MKRIGLAVIGFSAFLYAGCDPVPLQHPPGSVPSPPSYSTATGTQPTGPQPPPDINGAQRWQHAWNKGMEGFAMGSIAGPYGAGGGLIIGLITGLFTADSHYQQLHTQVQTEHAKDKDLEAQIEQEIERQRELEIQLAKGTAPADTRPTGKEILTKEPVKGNEKTLPIGRGAEVDRMVSLGKREAPAAAPAPFKNVEIKDVNQDGVPDLWIYYNPVKLGEIVRQEEDTNSDGRVDTWSTFSGGKLVRREVDTAKEGRPDVMFYYDKDKITREERDEKRDGRPSYRAVYRDGRLARVERDVSGDGNMDLWVTYDTAKAEQVVLKEESDLDGDGSIDLWTYYEAGRLVRRDVTAPGMEVLAKRGEIPSAAMEPQKIALPDR